MICFAETGVVDGKRLGQLRQENGFSQAALAQALGVTRQAVSAWERGASLPSTENLVKLSQLYQVDLAVLIGRDKQPSAKPEGQDESAAEPQPSEPARRAPRKSILWLVFLLAACAILCAALLILRTLSQETDKQDETEVIPISGLNSEEIELLPEDYADLGFW